MTSRNGDHITTLGFQSHLFFEGKMQRRSGERILHFTRCCGEIFFRIWWANS